MNITIHNIDTWEPLSDDAADTIERLKRIDYWESFKIGFMEKYPKGTTEETLDDILADLPRACSIAGYDPNDPLDNPDCDMGGEDDWDGSIGMESLLYPVYGRSIYDEY